MKQTRKTPPRRRGKASAARRRSVDLYALLHELQVHAEEITVQNEQLIKAQAEIERARDRFSDLYDFAPIGYMTLDLDGTIRALNFAGAALLARPRHFLTGLPITALISDHDRDRFRAFLMLVRETGRLPPIEISVKGTSTVLNLISQRQDTDDGMVSVLVAMIDATEQRAVENERRAAFEREQARAAELARENRSRTLAEERVKALLQRLVNVQEEERRRIALNLHDHLGQQLTALRLNLSMLRGGSQHDRRQALAAVERIVDQLDRDVDVLAWDLRPAVLDDSGLPSALQGVVDQWSALTGIPTQLQVGAIDTVQLPRDSESQLYRILQEALNNIAKHAAATAVSVMLERRGDDTLLIIEDNGRGFNVESGEAMSRQRGMGLIGIKERAALIGGQAQIESAPGQGTTVYIRVPVPRP